MNWICELATELSSTFRIRSLPQWPVWFPETLSMGVHPRARCRREMEGLAEMFRRSVLGGTDCQPPRNGHREQSWQSQDRRGPNDDQTRGRRPVALSAPQSKPQLEQRVLAELKCSLKKSSRKHWTNFGRRSRRLRKIQAKQVLNRSFELRMCSGSP